MKYATLWVSGLKNQPMVCWQYGTVLTCSIDKYRNEEVEWWSWLTTVSGFAASFRSSQKCSRPTPNNSGGKQIKKEDKLTEKTE